jgi:hypothetical protein
MFALLFLPTVFASYTPLVRLRGPCYGEEKDWNCVRVWDLEAYETLGETDRYGFVEGEDRGRRDLNDLFDHGYNNTATIPKFATNYLVLDFPEELRTVIEWFKTNRENTEGVDVMVNEIVPGNYANDKEESTLSILSLDKGSGNAIHKHIQRVMKPILAEWADESEGDLIFTALYGVREYSRDSQMLMHVDRHTTHHISAVVHLYQDGMDEGWPFSIQVGDKVSEIFCSKPCLVLYESASCFHGRPRRLQGNAYASAFIHYKLKDTLLEQYKEQMKKDEL